MKSEKEKMLTGMVFKVSDPELVAERQRARKLGGRFNRLGEDHPAQGLALIKKLFGHVGRGCEIHPQFRCDYGYNISIGDDFFANYDCVMLDVSPIRIGKHCLCLVPGSSYIPLTTRWTPYCGEMVPMGRALTLQLVMMFGLGVGQLSVPECLSAIT